MIQHLEPIYTEVEELGNIIIIIIIIIIFYIYITILLQI